jgi:O-antigen/teichoic acid export membrane protein
MGIIVRQSIITTIISYVGVAIGYVNLLYLYPRYLSPEQVGLMRTLQDSAILMAQFAQFGLAQSIIRFFPKFREQPDGGKPFINGIVLAGIGSFTVFLLVFFGFEKSIVGYFETNAAEFIHYTGLALWLTFITVMTTLLEVYSRSLLKNVLPNFLKEIFVRVGLAVLALLYFREAITFEQVMTGSVLIYALSVLILFSTLAAEGRLGLRFSFSMEPGVRKELIRFSLLSFAGTAGMIVIGKVDSLMVAGLLGLAPVAVYTTAFYMATVIEIPKRAMTQVATPLISRGFEKNNMIEVSTIYRKTALNQFIIGTLLLIGIAANLDSIFFFMPKGDVYAAGKWVVLIIGAGKLVDMLFGPSSEIIVYSKYYAFNILLIVLLAVVIVTANNYLIPAYGINGAAAAAALAMVVFNGVKFVFIWIKLGIQPFSFQFTKVLSIGAVAWTASMLLPRVEPVWLDMIVRSGLIAIIFSALVLGLKISPEANEIARKAMAKIRG